MAEEEMMTDPITDLREWLDQYGPDVSGLAYVYRHGTAGKKEMIGKYALDALPETDEIAACGPGKYQIWTKLPTGEQKSTYLNIAQEYTDRIRRGKYPAPPVDLPQVAAPSAASGLDTIKSVLEVLAPLLKPQNIAQDMSQVWSMMQTMQAQSMQMMQNLFERQSTMQMRMMNEIQARIEEHPEMTPPEENQSVHPISEIINRVLPLIQEFLPLLRNPMTAPAIAATAKSKPEFQQITSTPGGIEELAERAAEEYGEEEAAAALRGLGIQAERDPTTGRFVSKVKP